MSGGEQATIGQLLREAREAQGLAVEAAAARLRLMHRQVEAMEADDFETLGRPVFARGFVRNYARLLGLDPESLLSRMEGPPTEPVTVRRAEPPLPRSWLSSPWLILLLFGLLLAVAVPVGLYWWLNSGEDELLSQMPTAEKVEPVPLALPAPTPAVPAAEPVVAPAPAEASAEAQPEVPASAPAPAPVATPVQDESAAPAAPTDGAVGGVLNFEFAGDAWVEIRDGGGRMLHRQLNPAGSRIEVRGQPPFRVLVGNASQARMTYNGRPIDLKPFIDVTVARFTLEE